MENPKEEIKAVVRSLCQGTPAEQSQTLDQFFTPDAAFIHPFCTVPSFNKRFSQLFGTTCSRNVVRCIFQWYRMLSPTIVIHIDTVLHDEIRDKLYLDMRQTFSIFFIPFYCAPVRLVTVLDLVSDDDMIIHEPLDRLSDVFEKAPGDDESDSGQTTSKFHTSVTLNDRKIWRISKQEDLYQVNEFLKFTGFGLLSYAWFLFQLSATAVCVLMSFFLRYSPWAFQKTIARGGVQASFESDGTTEDDDSDASKSDQRKARGTAVEEKKASGQLDGTKEDNDEGASKSGEDKTRGKAVEEQAGSSHGGPVGGSSKETQHAADESKAPTSTIPGGKQKKKKSSQ